MHFELLKKARDINIQLMVRLIEKVNETYRMIKNVNFIEVKEDGKEE